MKKAFVTFLLPLILSATACANQNFKDSSPSLASAQTEAENFQYPKDSQNTKYSSGKPEESRSTAGFPDEYYALIENCIGNAAFGPAEESRLNALSDLLKNHYDVTGRAAGDSLEYYLAVRRKDAPVYDDFSSLDIGYVNGQLYMGYYDRESNPTVLYELEGYELLDMPLGFDNLDSICLGIYGAPGTEEHPAFEYAFSQEGRLMLDFMKTRPELSFYSKGQPFVKFYYQNEETVKFYTEPYPCYIALTDEEQEKIRSQIAASKPVTDIKTEQEAREYMKKEGEIYSTGASLCIDGYSYSCFGNHKSSGYILVTSEDQYEFQYLMHDETVYRFIMDKVKCAIGMDYGNFEPQWFQIPLKSASITFPEYMDTEDDSPHFELRTQSIENPDKLEVLSTLMAQAIQGGECSFSKCPYTAFLDFVREDGETLRIFCAVDSCDSMAYEGRIGFNYGSQADLAAIFDEAMESRR